jgi:hypothetical protein
VGRRRATRLIIRARKLILMLTRSSAAPSRGVTYRNSPFSATSRSDVPRGMRRSAPPPGSRRRDRS